MIPREILKKIRQIKLRTNRIVTGFAPGARASTRFTARTSGAFQTNPALNSVRPLKRRERRAPIPTGLCPSAQGCEERATLGHHSAKFVNRNAVVAIRFSFAGCGIYHYPV